MLGNIPWSPIHLYILFYLLNSLKFKHRLRKCSCLCNSAWTANTPSRRCMRARGVRGAKTRGTPSARRAQAGCHLSGYVSHSGMPSASLGPDPGCTSGQMWDGALVEAASRGASPALTVAMAFVGITLPLSVGQVLRSTRTTVCNL